MDWASKFLISTYSSGSYELTVPSKKMYVMRMSPEVAGGGVVGEAVWVGVEVKVDVGDSVRVVVCVGVVVGMGVS